MCITKCRNTTTRIHLRWHEARVNYENFHISVKYSINNNYIVKNDFYTHHVFGDEIDRYSVIPGNILTLSMIKKQSRLFDEKLQHAVLSRIADKNKQCKNAKNAKNMLAHLTSVPSVATSSVKGLPKTPEHVTSPEKSNTNTQMLSPIYNEARRQ